MEGIQLPDIQLPEELVEKIVAMMPFPQIFKAKVLSKSWLAKFSPIASHEDEDVSGLARPGRFSPSAAREDDEVQKHLITRFQELVGEQSINWDTFSPLSLSRQDPAAYNLETQEWQGVISLSFLPRNAWINSLKLIQGAVLLWVHQISSQQKDLYLANILTRSWRMLPPCPYPYENNYIHCVNIVKETSSQMYKIVLFSEGRPDELSVQIYDSQANVWSSKEFEAAKPSHEFYQDVELSQAVCLNGLFYMMGDLSSLFVFNVEEGTVEELKTIVEEENFNIFGIYLVVCNNNLMVVVDEDDYDSHARYWLYKIDLGSRRLSKVSDGPPASLSVGTIETQPGSLGDYILFGVENEDYLGRVLAYNICKDEWSCFPFHSTDMGSYDPSSFQPGLHTFLVV